MAGLIEFLNSPKGKPVAMAFFLVAVVGAGWFIISSLGGSAAQVSSTDRVFVCSETGKTFRYTLKVGDSIPVKSPHSGKNTGYEPELCYWTADGKPKAEPTYVLLNETVGKKGPTFCPDCKRLVVGFNPPAGAGTPPPPTEAEYNARRR